MKTKHSKEQYFDAACTCDMWLRITNKEVPVPNDSICVFMQTSSNVYYDVLDSAADVLENNGTSEGLEESEYLAIQIALEKAGMA